MITGGTGAQLAIWSRWSHFDNRRMRRISHGSSGVWAVDRAGKIYNWNSGWKHVNGRLVHISSGKSVWGVSKNDNIYRYRGNNKWTHIPGKLMNVSFVLGFHLRN